MTISADQTTGHLYVLSEDDAIDEPSGSVTATLQARSGYTLGASVSASVQVKDNDPPPTITIAAVTTAVTEGQPAVFTVTANPAPADDLTVNLRARDAGAWFYWPEKAGVGTFLHSYYVNATVTIPGGTSSVNYELPTRDDNFHENGASVSVSLKPRGGYSLGNPKEAWVRVNDNDPDLPIITIAAGPLVTEGTPSAFTITANRAPVSNLTVNLHVAEYGFGDHVAPGETGIKQVTIPAGDRSARYSVATVDDTTHEGQGHVTVNLRSGDGYVVGAGDFWAVNAVNDNDPRPGNSVISINGGVEVTEGSPAVFTFEASPAPASDLTVKFSVADVEGAGDFVASTEEGSKEVTILAGASSASYSVPTVDDATGDADGEVTVTGASGSGYEFRRGTAKVWVRDNDNPVIVSLRRVDSGKIYESGGDNRAELTVSLNRALAAGEYLEVPLDIHTLRSSGHSRYGLRPSDFALSLKSGAGVTLNRATFMTRTATSDRYPVLLFEGAGAQTATLEVVAQHDGVAESHQDEEFAVIILPSTETVSGFRWLTNVADGTRRASSNYSVKIAISDSDTVSILRFIQPTGACCVEYRAREGEPIQIRLRLSAPLAKNATFTLMDKGYTLPAPSWQTRNAPQAATAGADYARGPWTVTIPAGQRQAWVRIGTFKDGDANEGGVNGAANLGFGLGSFREDDMYEVFHVWVDESKLPPGVFVPSNWPVPVYGSSRAIRAAILDEEKPALSFESRSMVVQEDAGTVTLKVKVDPPSKSPINVEYRLLGTATPRVDYRIANAHDRNGNSGLLRIPANQGTVDMQVEIIDDALEDTNETIRIELTARSDATGQQYRGYQVFSNTVADPSSISLVIRNDDGLPMVNIAPKAGSPSSVPEGSATAFTVTRSAAAATPLTVSVDVLESAGNDFVASVDEGRRSVTIAANEATADFTVGTVNDSTDEPDGTVTAKLAAGTGYALWPAPDDEASVAVTDDDVPPPPPTCPATSTELVEKVRGYYELNRSRADRNHGENWLRVLIAFGAETHATLQPYTSAEARAGESAWDGWVEVREELERLEACGNTQQPLVPPPTPEITLAGGAGVTEGGDAEFTLTATPAPASDIQVSVTVAEVGSFAASGATGARTVTVGTGGTATFTVATENDTADEPDGMINAGVAAGSGYTLGGSTVASVAVTDDDAPAQPQTTTCAATSADLVEKVRGYYELNRSRADRNHGENWLRVLIAFGAETHATLQPYTSAEARAGEPAWDGWVEIREELERLEGCGGSQEKLAPPPTPVITISGGAGVTEGGDAVFTLTAAPTPASAIEVSVTVTETGSFAASGATGARAVTVGTGGTAAFTVATENDTTDEPDGSIEAAVAAGSGYTVGGSATASVAVADNDDPPVPEVNITASAGGTEGEAATFTLTAAPAPASALVVGVTVAATGDYGVAAGDRNVTIPTGGSATLTVATTDDSADEPNGAVTVTLNAGSGYTVGALSTGTADILDDDEPVQPQTRTSTFAPDAQLVSDIRQWRGETGHGQDHVDRWTRVLIALGVETGTLTPMTVAEAQAFADRGWTRWERVVNELKRKEAHDAPPATPVTPPPAVPTVTLSGNGAVTEGAGAAFTVSRAGDTATALTVLLAVSEDTSGGRDFVAANDEGNKQVVIQAGSATATFTVPTSGDSADEPDGAVTLALRADAAYASGSPSSATVAVSDDDDAPPPPPGLPAVSIDDATAREGQGMVFTVRLSAPATNHAFVYVKTRDSSPASATANVDYQANHSSARVVIIHRGSRERQFSIQTHRDAHDDDGETFEVAVTEAWMNSSNGARALPVADGVAVGTICDPGADCPSLQSSLSAVQSPEGFAGGGRILEPAAEPRPGPGTQPRPETQPLSAPRLETGAACVSPELLSEVRAHSGASKHPATVERWLRVLHTFTGAANDATIMLSAEARTYLDLGPPQWAPVVTAIQCLEARAMR